MGFDTEDTDCLDLPTAASKPKRQTDTRTMVDKLQSRKPTHNQVPDPPADKVPIGLIKKEDAVRIVARRLTDLALATLAAICERGRNETARIAAAKEILDRGWGKSSQQIAHANEKPGAEITVNFGTPPRPSPQIDLIAEPDTDRDDG